MKYLLFLFLFACGEKIEKKGYYHINGDICEERYISGFSTKLEKCSDSKQYVLSDYFILKIENRMVYKTEEIHVYYEVLTNYKCILQMK